MYSQFDRRFDDWSFSNLPGAQWTRIKSLMDDPPATTSPTASCTANSTNGSTVSTSTLPAPASRQSIRRQFHQRQPRLLLQQFLLLQIKNLQTLRFFPVFPVRQRFLLPDYRQLRQTLRFFPVFPVRQRFLLFQHFDEKFLQFLVLFEFLQLLLLELLQQNYQQLPPSPATAFRASPLLPHDRSGKTSTLPADLSAISSASRAHTDSRATRLLVLLLRHRRFLQNYQQFLLLPVFFEHLWLLLLKFLQV